MPLARIITNSADDSLELAMQLRSRGFRVETVAPDYVPGLPADVEVRLEECAPEDVLTRAVVVKESEDLWVFVAPGALDEQARPIEVIPLIPEVLRASPLETDAPPVAKVVVELPYLEPEHDPNTTELDPLRARAHALPKVASADRSSARAEATPAPALEAATMAVPTGKSSEPVRPEIRRVTASKPIQKTRHRVLPKAADIPQIPKVPERVEPTILPVPAASHVAHKTSFRISLCPMPRFWRTASAVGVLAVLAWLLAAIILVRPPSPAREKRDAAAPQPAFFSPVPQVEASSPTAHPRPSPAVAPKKKTPAPTVASRPGGANAAQDIGNARSQRQRSVSDMGLIAEDTVVFYNRTPGAHPVKNSSRPDVKRHSDLN